MASTIRGRNSRAQRAAKKSQRSVFYREIVEYMPACVDCGLTIRVRGNKNGERSCGCHKKIWVCDSRGWHPKGM